MSSLRIATRNMDLKGDLWRLGLTFAIALITGWTFLQLGMPAPFLIGSLFGVWIFGRLFKPVRHHLGVARWFHIPVILGLGVLIGANFTGEVFTKLSQWSLTVSIMIGTTILVSTIGYLFLRRIHNFEPGLAFLCCIPGGQAEALALARDTVEKDYVVALFHLVRVVFVFVSTPLLLAFVQGATAVNASNLALQSMPSIFDLGVSKLALFVAIAIFGYLGAKLAKIPMAHLLGPMGLSTLFHAMDWVELPRVQEFVLLAQLAIGGAVGARLSRVPFDEVIGYLKIASVNTVMILTTYFMMAMSIAHFSGTGFMHMWMAFVPGGLYEVTLLALIFGFDVAFVAFHHTVRVMMIFLSMPALVSRLRR